METIWSGDLERQFGAGLDMIENAIGACPDGLWSDRSKTPEFWYVTFHVLFWTDLYLHGTLAGFAPPEPYTLDELDPAGIVPASPYSRAQMREYLEHCRARLPQVASSLAGAGARDRSGIAWIDGSASELQLYNLRHVQHHAGQLQLLLRQAGIEPPRWVTRGGVKP